MRQLGDLISNIDRILAGFLQGEDGFRRILKTILKDEMHIGVLEFSRQSKIPSSTLYKIISGEREPTLRVLRRILLAINGLESAPEKGFIGIIAARPVIEKVIERRIVVEGEPVVVREYSASTVEDAIVAAVSAERDGASAVVCAPIIGPTVGKIVRIPVIPIMPEQSVVRAIKAAAKRSRGN